MLEIKVEIKNLSQIQSALMKSPEIVARHMNDAIKKSIFDIKNETTNTVFKHGSGSYGILGSMQVKWGPLRGELFPTKKYSHWLHEGTKPHMINSPVLIRGVGWRYIKMHPGFKGNPFLKNAVDRSQNKINKNFEEGLSDALEEIAGGA